MDNISLFVTASVTLFASCEFIFSDTYLIIFLPRYIIQQTVNTGRELRG